METINELYDRSYINFVKDKAFIWPNLRTKEDLVLNFKPEVWDLQTFRNYLAYLEKNETV